MHSRQIGSRGLGWLAASLVMAVGMICCSVLHAQDDREQALVQLANQAREDAGLKPLAWDPALAAAAHAHAVRMAQAGAIEHQYRGEPSVPERAASAGAHFSLIEENIAMSDTAFHVHQSWMRSPAHHDNLMNPKIDRIGVALVPAHGELYAVADYAQGVESIAPEQLEARIGRVLTGKGLRLKSDGTAAARQYCAAEGNGGSAGVYARFLMRWQSSDAAKLPPELEQRIASGVFHEAAVGACAPQGDGRSRAPVFSGYRVAVLLY